ncbi:MAG: SAM-dependent DNA methyltransferase [Saprospiraceae bacterium]|nr:SAM-dependent DNA methyltransferase [Saprospiraceae bacterium]
MSSTIVQKIWNFCNTLRDDGVSYGDYLEQLTYLLFLKMADEYSKPPHKRTDINIPAEMNWESLTEKSGDELERHYNKILRSLGKEKGILGQIFTKSQNKIQDPAKLYKLIQLIDAENWVGMGVKDKGDIYEGILKKNAEDTKSGAGQYFTPRELISAMVECVRPEPKKTIADPACGTGGFFLGAYDFLASQDLDKSEREFLKSNTFFGNEIVANTRRICLMNLFLHGIGDISAKENFISSEDALLSTPKTTFDYVLANPPFGKKSSMTITNEDGEEEKDDLIYNRQDFIVTTSNKQLNFLQHIMSMLNTTGKAAVVLPDNVLFEGGVGEKVRQALLQKTDLHTILRLPTGIFYAHGVKANVLFFEGKPASKNAWTKEIWVYDYRTNVHHTLKKNPLNVESLRDFITCYNPKNRHKRKETWSKANPEGRWRKYNYDDIIARDKTSLDISWLKDNSLADLDNLPDPDVLAAEIIENLEAGLESFKTIVAALKNK